MAQINATGYMHNRLRMVAGSFLAKHLGLDWRWGERYFAQHLNDSQASIPEETGATTQTNNQQQLSTQTTQPNSIPTTTTEQPTINFLELLNRPTNPPHTQVLSRKKRHWLSQAFSDLTGLATQTDLNILNANEEKMRLEEEKTQKELKTIETKTQNIIQIIDEQAVKMAKLYSDEAEVKQAIKIVLKGDVLCQYSYGPVDGLLRGRKEALEESRRE